jgi:hypothetical protein
MRRRSRFRALTLLVVVALSATPALAGGREMIRRSMEARGVFASLWHALSAFLPLPGNGRGAGDPNGALLKGRSTIDPDGAPAPGTPTESESDGRGTIDPNG